MTGGRDAPVWDVWGCGGVSEWVLGREADVQAGLGARGPGGARALAVAVERGGWRPRPAAPLPPPLPPPARPLRQPRGRPAERRRDPQARTPTKSPSRRSPLRGAQAPRAALEGWERSQAAGLQVKAERLARLQGLVGYSEGRTRPRHPLKLSRTAGPGPPPTRGGAGKGTPARGRQ